LDNNATIIAPTQESIDPNIELHVALKPLATTAQAVAIQDDIVAEILNLRAEISNQLIVLRGDLVGQIEAMRREPVGEHEDPSTQINELQQDFREKIKRIPTAQQLVLGIVAGNAAVAAVVVAAMVFLR
jgi:hypothetical protein